MKPKIKFEDVKPETEKTILENIVKKENIYKSNANFIPIDDLPSKYYFYPEGTKIYAKPMKVNDVKLLASLNQHNFDIVINQVLSRNVTGIDIDNILRSDKFYLIFWLRANTYKDAGYEVDFHCQHCEKDSKYNFDVDVLDVKYAKEGIDLVKEMPKSKDKIKTRFKSVLDETKMLEFKKLNSGSIDSFDDDFLDLAMDIEMVNDSVLTLFQKYEYIKNMEPIDYSFLISFVNSVGFGVENVINATCNSCKGVTPQGVNFRSDFFIPKFEF